MAANNIFNKIQVKTAPRSRFDLSHAHTTTFGQGALVPILCQEVLPSDSFNIRVSNMVRLAPMIAPAMTNMKLKMSAFFVPNRIVWPGWEPFISPPGQNSVPPPPPVIPSGVSIPAGSLGNMLGLPVSVGPAMGNPAYGLQASAIPFAAYQRIYFDYFRDQNLENPDEVEYPPLTNGVQSVGDWSRLSQIRYRSWSRDYFTSALPFAQKGQAVSIPVSGSVDGTGEVYLNTDSTNAFGVTNAVTNLGKPAVPLISDSAAWLGNAIDPDRLVLNPNGRLSVDGDEFTVADITTTINDLRTAYALQRFLEKNARAGSRYIEALKAHFGAAPLDYRLQRPELFGVSTQRVVISEVLQTSESVNEDGTPQGNMAGHGITANKGEYFSYFAQEHGYIIILASITPDALYSQGMPKHFQRFDRFDYAWPDFAHLGEQALYNKEVFAQLTNAFGPAIDYNNDIFGYMPMFGEYRFTNSRVSADFAPGESLDFWTQARQFDAATPPHLNTGFLNSGNASRRIFAVENGVDHFMATFHFDISAKRPLPKYGTPI